MPTQVTLPISGLTSTRYTEEELYAMAHGLQLQGKTKPPAPPRPIKLKRKAKCRGCGVCTCGKHAVDVVAAPTVSKAEVVAWIRRYASLYSARQQNEVDILRHKIEAALPTYPELAEAFKFARKYVVR